MLNSCVVMVIVRWHVVVCCLLGGLFVGLITFSSVLKSFECYTFWVCGLFSYFMIAMLDCRILPVLVF